MRTAIFFTSIILFVLLANMPKTVRIGSLTFTRPVINTSIFGKNFFRDMDFKLGLDLQGGTHLVYEVDTSQIEPDQRDSAIAATRDNIERRVNLLGVSESLVQTSKVGDIDRLIVELPGIQDVAQAMATIGQTAQLDFREVQIDPSTSSAVPVFIPTGLTGADLKIAQVQFAQGSGQISGAPSVGLTFNEEGTKKFAEITKRNVGNQVAIFLDGEVVTAPRVEVEITDGQAVISGNFTIEEAKLLTVQLNAGALPVPIHIVEQRNIGATLGNESVLKSLIAGLIGFVFIMIFMIVNYGVKGVIADVALTLYVLLTLALFKIIPVTLTLAGIAGFILSIGMAVDANILIFERMKEEILWGRPKRAAMELGFHRAWTSVRDSNASSLITAGILFWFGTGSVRGFALTLIVGILVSLFTSITITRSLLRAVYSKKI